MSIIQIVLEAHEFGDLGQAFTIALLDVPPQRVDLVEQRLSLSCRLAEMAPKILRPGEEPHQSVLIELRDRGYVPGIDRFEGEHLGPLAQLSANGADALKDYIFTTAIDSRRQRPRQHKADQPTRRDSHI